MSYKLYIQCCTFQRVNKDLVVVKCNFCYMASSSFESQHYINFLHYIYIFFFFSPPLLYMPLVQFGFYGRQFYDTVTRIINSFLHTHQSFPNPEWIQDIFRALPHRLLNIVEVKLYDHKLKLLQIQDFQVQLVSQCHLANLQLMLVNSISSFSFST